MHCKQDVSFVKASFKFCEKIIIERAKSEKKIRQCERTVKKLNKTLKTNRKQCSNQVKEEKDACDRGLIELQMVNQQFANLNSDCDKPCNLPKLGKPVEKLINISSGYYYVSKTFEKENWYLADFQCKLNGFKLASLETEEEHNEISKALNKEIDDFWISGTDLGSEGRFYWAANGKSVMNFADFEFGQPDNKDGKEHCLRLKKSRVQLMPVYRWDDSNCGCKFRYICEVITTD
ncbi:Hypothetical predicted protein [Cloeon dipterum]|uniref:C-type lectin domain-containing protein n=1 Tax=Cloeon dipterum TaxID=197152 RepID=A0A8S1BRR5_9INSE|nr:Hypothetical predicted protein [Cloeon dipterum]